MKFFAVLSFVVFSSAMSLFALYARPLTAQPSSFLYPRLGLCEDYPEESRSSAELSRDMSILRATSSGVLRVSLGWDDIEAEKDDYNWAFWDELVVLAKLNGVTLIPYVAYTPEWNRGGGDDQSYWKHPPADYREFQEFMQIAAARYQDDIQSWEIWNEPDNRDYWEGSTEQYAKLLAAGAAGVRAGNPNAKIVFGGISWDVDFLRDLFRDYNAASHVDVVNVHNYFETWFNKPIENIEPYLLEVAAVVKEYGDGEDIWAAEVGYSTYRRGNHVSDWYTARFPYEHTLDFQAVQLIRTMALILATKVTSLIAWYEIKDLPPSSDVIGDINNRHLGIISPDYTAKPAFHALKFMNTQFEKGYKLLNTALVGRHQGVVVRAFELPGGEALLFAWTMTNLAEDKTAVDHVNIDVQIPWDKSIKQAHLLGIDGQSSPFSNFVKRNEIITVKELKINVGQVTMLKILPKS